MPMTRLVPTAKLCGNSDPLLTANEDATIHRDTAYNRQHFVRILTAVSDKPRVTSRHSSATVFNPVGEALAVFDNRLGGVDQLNASSTVVVGPRDCNRT
jgi:hypothetical protein